MRRSGRGDTTVGSSPADTHKASMNALRRIVGGAVLLAAALAAALPAQAPPPPFRAVSPAMTSRSPLAVHPVYDSAETTRLSIFVDAGSAIEFDWVGFGHYVLDAELLRVSLAGRRDVGRGAFLMGELGVFGVYDGVADAFFDKFHHMTGFPHTARAQRPRNEFGYYMALEGDTIAFARPGMSLDDARVAVGMRHGSRHQTILGGTIPLGAPEGFGRRVPTVFVSHGLWTPVGARVRSDFTANVGFAPKHGKLSEIQREVFAAASSSISIRTWRDHAIYGTLFYHSAAYEDTPFRELNRRDFSLDFGWQVSRPGGRQWWFGLTEDFNGRDSAIDLMVRAGASW